MTARTIKNMASSVRQRLLNVAHERGDDFNLLLSRYVHERLMYRLDQSSESDHFVVKGATLFTLWSLLPHRATRDLDLLGFGAPDIARLETVFRVLCAVAVDPDDGVKFDPDSVRAHAIREQALYDGIRIEMRAHLGSARVRVQVDVGFGDAIVPAPELTTFPAILDLPAPRLRAYARETVIAEKLHAMVDLGMANSRMKDYFDIWFLSQHFEFDAHRLCSAIDATFATRGSALPRTSPLGLSDAFALDPGKGQQWQAFVRRTRPRASTLSLPDTIADIRGFILPLLEHSPEHKSLVAHWRPSVGWHTREE